MSETEIWKPVIGWPRYEVSNLGSVRRVAPAKFNPKCGPLKPHQGGDYPSVKLRHDGKARRVFVHQLVCEAFRGPRPTPKHEVAHKDGTRTNFTADNLRWATHRENSTDDYGHGKIRFGERANGAKLKRSDVTTIIARVSAGESQKDVAASFGVSPSLVSRIMSGDVWPDPESRRLERIRLVAA